MLKVRNIITKDKNNEKIPISQTFSYFFKNEFSQSSASNLKSYLGEGVWLGGLAKEFGMLGDTVKLNDFEALTTNVNPKTGEKFGKKNKGDYNFIELTFSVPKDFSMLAFLDEEVGFNEYNNMLQRAFSKTMNTIEAEAVSRINSGNQLVSCPNLIYACFQHETSRATKHPETRAIIEPDPQLHIHTILNKYVMDSDGKVRTIEADYIFNRQLEFGAMFRAHLANELRSIGFEIEEHEDVMKTKNSYKKIKSFGVVGFSDEQRLAFSNRKREIEEIAKKLGITSTKGKDAIAKKFRTSKMKFKKDKLLESWRAKAERNGIDQDYIQSLKTFKMDAMHSVLKTDEELILSAINVYNGKEYLTERNIRERLSEYSQYIPIDVNEKFAKFLDDGLIKKVGKFNYIATFNKIEKTPRQVKFYEMKSRVKPQKFLKDYCKSNGIDFKSQNFKYLNFLDVSSQQATITPSMIKEYQASEGRKESSVISSTSNTIESLYASIDALERRLRTGKLSVDEASKIQAQIKAIYMQIQELEKRKKNAPKPQ